MHGKEEKEGIALRQKVLTRSKDVQMKEEGRRKKSDGKEYKYRKRRNRKTKNIQEVVESEKKRRGR
jgi:hypothetical protein